MILQIKKLAIIEDGSPDNIVRLSPVTEGPEGAAVFGISNEHEQFFIEDRQTYVDRGNPTCEIAVLKPDSADITQLESWVNNQTDVYISAYTIDGGYFFGDKETATGAVKLVANEQLSDNDLFAITVQKQTTPGFSPDDSFHQNGFWAGENLIGIHEWADVDGDNIADGWSRSVVNLSFSSGQQSYDSDTSYKTFTKRIYFPFNGVEITFSMDFDSLTGDYASNQLLLDYRNTSGSSITTEFTNVSTTGRKSVTGTTPATSNLSYIVVQNGIQANTGTVTNVVSDPCLRIGTGTTYTKF